MTDSIDAHLRKRIEELERDVEMWKAAAERWRQIAKGHEREKADLIAFTSRFSVIQRCPKCGRPSNPSYCERCD